MEGQQSTRGVENLDQQRKRLDQKNEVGGVNRVVYVENTSRQFQRYLIICCSRLSRLLSMATNAITAFRNRATNRDNLPNRTPFYPRRKVAIDEIYDRLNRELLTPWAFFHSGKLITVTNFEGREIRFNGGLEFEGSPRVLFCRSWGSEYLLRLPD